MKIEYIIKRSRRRTISITIQEDSKVLVNAPIGVDVFTIEKFLSEKRNWILRKIEKNEKQNACAEQMGFLSQDDLKEIKKKAKKLIPERVEFYAKKTGISYNKIFIRLQKSRWGSCSRDGNLNFNCLLVLMPLEILDSVVVHELCHRLQMNHSKAFYAEVLALFPEYKKCDKWLKQNGKTYLLRARKIL